MNYPDKNVVYLITTSLIKSLKKNVNEGKFFIEVFYTDNKTFLWKIGLMK